MAYDYDHFDGMEAFTDVRSYYRCKSRSLSGAISHS